MELIIIFFGLYFFANTVKFSGKKSLFFEFFCNIGSKLLLISYLYFHSLELANISVKFLNLTMIIAVSFALQSAKYTNFFQRTDFAQTVFLVDLFAIGMPFLNFQKFLYQLALPYFAANIILIAVGHFLERAKKTAYLEDFYNLFSTNKIASIAAIFAMIFLAGLPPLRKLFLYEKILTQIQYSHWKLILTMSIAFSLAYIYFKWILAMLYKTKNMSSNSQGQIQG